MQGILESLFHQHGLAQEDKSALQRIAANTGMLKKDFNKWQKKRFLRIIDSKDLIAYKQARDSFANGVRYGAMFMIEVLNEKDVDIAD